MTTGGERGSPLGLPPGLEVLFNSSSQSRFPRRCSAPQKGWRFAGRQADLQAGCPTWDLPFFFPSPPRPKDSRRDVILLSPLGPEKARFRKVVGRTGLQLLLVGTTSLASGVGRNLSRLNPIEYLLVVKSLHTLRSAHACYGWAASYCLKPSGKPQKD